MTFSENLLVTAMEECAEIQQDVSKILRFGADNHHPERPNHTNADCVTREYIQLKAESEELQRIGVFPVIDAETEEDMKRRKLDKVFVHQAISRDCGCLED